MEMNQVTLPVSDMDEATSFYRKLGFLHIVDSPHYARFECPDGGASFSLSLDKEHKDSGSVIYFEHEELDDLVKKLKGKGIHFDQDPTDMPYLWREAVIHDPSGNKIKLYWAGSNRLYPPWRVEKNRCITKQAKIVALRATGLAQALAFACSVMRL